MSFEILRVDCILAMICLALMLIWNFIVYVCAKDLFRHVSVHISVFGSGSSMDCLQQILYITPDKLKFVG